MQRNWNRRISSNSNYRGRSFFFFSSSSHLHLRDVYCRLYEPPATIRMKNRPHKASQFQSNYEKNICGKNNNCIRLDGMTKLLTEYIPHVTVIWQMSYLSETWQGTKIRFWHRWEASTRMNAKKKNPNSGYYTSSVWLLSHFFLTVLDFLPCNWDQYVGERFQVPPWWVAMSHFELSSWTMRTVDDGIFKDVDQSCSHAAPLMGHAGCHRQGCFA